VIVDDLHAACVSVLPGKTDPPLIVDSNTVLTGSPAFELLEPVAGRNTEILELFRSIDKPQLSKQDPMKVRGETSDRLPLEKALGVPISEAVNHLQY
jgi:hypothetical protein